MTDDFPSSTLWCCRRFVLFIVLIALVDSDSREYLLNGNFVVSPYQKSITYGGVVFDYTGAEATVERLNSSNKQLKQDLIVQVRGRGNQTLWNHMT